MMNSRVSYPQYKPSCETNEERSIFIESSVNSLETPTLTLIDTGSTDSFIDATFVKEHNLPIHTLDSPISTSNFDGSSSQYGVITQYVTVDLRIGTHYFTPVHLLLTTITAIYNIVLGLNFSRSTSMLIDCGSRLIRFPESSKNRATSTEHTIIKPTNFDAEWLDEEYYEPPPKPTLEQLIPKVYHDFLDVFSKEKGESLPDHQPHDLKIELIPGSTPPFGGIYRLATAKSNSLKAYIDEMLEKGLIRESNSAAASPVLFVPKKGGELRLCVDYRRLNLMSIKNRYPLPSTDMLLDQLGRAVRFTKIDLRWAYHRIRIAAGYEWLTAFRTRYGLFEYLVMPFGLTNCPATFQRLVNTVLRQFIDKFVIVYLDDILIYSTNVGDHEGHVRQVLQALRENHLYAKAEKCDFHVEHVEYLGFHISPAGISMDPKKVSDVLDWTTPSNTKQLRGFLGFANFYRRFILGYSDVARPLYDLLRKDTPWNWTTNQQKAFDHLKQLFTTGPILSHFQPELDTRLETDASDFAIGAVLSQKHDDGLFHPIGYISRTLNSAERNYDVHDKEMLAIVFAAIEFRPLLMSTSSPFEIFTDHHSLEYFMSSKALNQRQARWSERLSDLHFTLHYRPGTANSAADGLSRREDAPLLRRDDASLLSGSASSAHDEQPPTFFQPHHHIRRQVTTSIEADNLVTTIKKCQQEDLELQRLFNEQAEALNYSIKDGLILDGESIVIPNDDELRLRILQARHDHPTAGHPGISKTLQLVRRDYTWKGIHKYITDYVKACRSCARAKATNHKKFGLLQPLPIPERPWSSISMDSVEPLPNSNGYNSILVVVDRLTKMALFIPTTTKITAQDLADIFIANVFSKHGTPHDIVSDRGSKFTSDFWTAFSQAVKIRQNLSTAFHPESDGQTERVNRIMETYLRLYVNYDQDDWSTHLPLAEFAYNNTPHSATTMSPFYANKGFNPTLEIAIAGIPRKNSVKLAELQRLHQHAKEEIAKAIKHFKEVADKHRDPTPTYVVGDEVTLSTKNIRTTQPSKKLSDKRLGPLKIIKIISPLAVQLKLPAAYSKIHDVFHVSLLEPVYPDLIKNRRQPPPPPVELLDDLQWEVNEILDSKLVGKNVHYLVEWKGFEDDAEEADNWQHWQNLEGAIDSVRKFHERHPTKPKALQLFPDEQPTPAEVRTRKQKSKAKTKRR